MSNHLKWNPPKFHQKIFVAIWNLKILSRRVETLTLLDWKVIRGQHEVKLEKLTLLQVFEHVQLEQWHLFFLLPIWPDFGTYYCFIGRRTPLYFCFLNISLIQLDLNEPKRVTSVWTHNDSFPLIRSSFRTNNSHRNLFSDNPQ